jgi:hypothetical protein
MWCREAGTQGPLFVALHPKQHYSCVKSCAEVNFYKLAFHGRCTTATHARSESTPQRGSRQSAPKMDDKEGSKDRGVDGRRDLPMVPSKTEQQEVALGSCRRDAADSARAPGEHRAQAQAPLMQLRNPPLKPCKARCCSTLPWLGSMLPWLRQQHATLAPHHAPSVPQHAAPLPQHAPTVPQHAAARQLGLELRRSIGHSGRCPMPQHPPWEHAS